MIKELGKRVIVSKWDINPERKNGSLILPHEKDEITARVIAVGPEVDDSLEFGDIVYLRQGVWFIVNIDGQCYMSVNQDDILAAWKDK